METIYFLLYLVAAICFALAAFRGDRVFDRWTVNLVALGLLSWVMVPLIHSLRAL